MHACNAVTLAQLLSVRDGEPADAGAVRHIDRCELCAQELTRLRKLQAALRALPAPEAPPYDPAALRVRLNVNLHGMRSYRVAGIAAAGVGALALMLALNVSTTYVPALTTSLPAIDTAATVTPNTPNEPTVSSLVIRSQELESRLQQLPKRPHVERGSTSNAIESLQDSIQWVDYQLSLASDVGMTDRQSVRLWQDRVQLMDSLVKVRYAEAQRAAYLVPISGSSL